jgi:hypothetical protein
LAKAEIYRIEVSKGCHLAKAEMNTWQRPKYTKKKKDSYLDKSSKSHVEIRIEEKKRLQATEIRSSIGMHRI